MFEKTKKKRRMKKAVKAYQKALKDNPRHLTYVPSGYMNRRQRRAMKSIAKRRK